MAHFAGFIGPDGGIGGGFGDGILTAAGSEAVVHRCAGGTTVTIVTIVSDGRPGESVAVTPCAQTGGIIVRRGDPRTAGCAVTISGSPGEPARFEADVFGQCGLFTTRSPEGGVCFASDPELLRPMTAGRVDAAALKGYLCFSHVPSPRTVWEGISAVETPPVWPERCRSSEQEPGADALQALLRAAVERRLTTGEVGVYLSGGLDSSLVAALLVEAGARPRLFTLDFGPPYNAEVPAAQAVADHLGLPLTVVPARPRDVLRAVAATARALPQPYGDSVTVPLYLLGRAARDHVREVWNGEGGDQLFGGWANKPMIAAISHGGDTGEAAELREYLETYHRFLGITDRLFTPALRADTADADPREWVRPALDRCAHPALLHRLRAANLLLKGAQNIAPRMVALAECHGLRVRAPFFDRDLAAATFALSPEKLLTGACEKFVLKQVAERYLPHALVWREKRGMGVPSTEWCLRHGPLGWDIRRRLSRRRLQAQGWFEFDMVRRLFRGDDPTPEGSFRRRRVGEKLWLLYMLQVWCDVHGVGGGGGRIVRSMLNR